MQTCRWGAAAAVVLCAGSIAFGAHAGDFDVRLELMDSLIVVPIHIDGQGPFRFVLDTAATSSTLHPRVATSLGLLPSGEVQVVTPAETFMVPTTVVRHLEISGLRVPAFRANLMRLDALHAIAFAAAGVLGQDVLSRGTLTIDYGRRRLRIDAAACDRGDVSLASTRADGRPMIDARLAGAGIAGNARLVVDSAANALLLFARHPHTGIAIIVNTLASEAWARVVPQADVQIAGLRFRQPAYVLPTPAPRVESGLLPASWFSRVCIDGVRQRVVLTR